MAITERLGASASLISLPPNLVKKYNALILSSPSTISQVESALRSLTYLLPGARLHDSELASESIYTLTNLLSLYHDSILSRSINTGASFKADPHARYTKYWMARSKLYPYLSRLLKTVQYTELLWEMVARRKGGERGKWRVVVFLESVKVILRLCLCWVTGGRWSLSSPLPERGDFKDQPAPAEEDINEWLQDESTEVNEKTRQTRFQNGLATPPLSESEKLAASSSASPTQSPEPSTASYSNTSPFKLSRTSISLPPLPTPSDISAYLSQKTLSASSIRPVKSLVHRLTTSQSQLAELLYILRPLVFALLMQRLSSRHINITPSNPSTRIGRPSWKREWMPWIIGLGMEYGSRQLMRRDIERRVPGGLRGLSDVEKEEFKRRGWNMLWFGMRGAFYESVTRQYILRFSNSLRSKPLLDLAAGIIDDYEYLWDSYYFSTTSM